MLFRLTYPHVVGTGPIYVKADWAFKDKKLKIEVLLKRYKGS